MKADCSHSQGKPSDDLLSTRGLEDGSKTSQQKTRYSRDTHDGDQEGLWVPEIQVISCELLIFVDEAVEPVEPLDTGGVGQAVFWERA